MVKMLLQLTHQQETHQQKVQAKRKVKTRQTATEPLHSNEGAFIRPFYLFNIVCITPIKLSGNFCYTH